MPQFNFTVDTKPMADSLLEVAGRVDNTTTAVIAMNEALVLAEAESAAKICKNVNFGFYSLIRSQVSQKIAAHKSKADAKIVELHQQSIALKSIKETMERDYQTLSSRYTKLFDGLNQSLRIRIFELNKPLMTFLNKEILPLLQRPAQLSAIPSTSQSETITSSQQIAVSNTRFNTGKNLQSMQGFLRHAEDQQQLIDKILIKQKNDSLITHAVPVIMSALQDKPDAEKEWQFQFPTLQTAAERQLSRKLKTAVYQCRWKDADEQAQLRIKQDFKKMVGASPIPERVKNRMMEFIQSANWKQAKA